MVDSRGDTEMLNFFIGYCNCHFIFPIFSESLVIRTDFPFGPKKGNMH